MKYSTLKEEKKLSKKGFKRITCLDEAGRGPLAGPVVAAAVTIKNPCLKWRFKHFRLRDSKKLTPKKRKEIYKILIKSKGIKFATGRVSEKIIDKINILEATKLAMQRAVRNLEKKLQSKKFYVSDGRLKRRKIDFLIIDGNFKISSKIPQKAIIKADERVFSCILASIIAKVTRDKIMEKYHQKYPQYGFAKHKGYGTKYHLKMLKKYGPCKIHRKSFWPIKKFLNRT